MLHLLLTEDLSLHHCSHKSEMLNKTQFGHWHYFKLPFTRNKTECYFSSIQRNKVLLIDVQKKDLGDNENSKSLQKKWQTENKSGSTFNIQTLDTRAIEDK